MCWSIRLVLSGGTSYNSKLHSWKWIDMGKRGRNCEITVNLVWVGYTVGLVDVLTRPYNGIL